MDGRVVYCTPKSVRQAASEHFAQDSARRQHQRQSLATQPQPPTRRQDRYGRARKGRIVVSLSSNDFALSCAHGILVVGAGGEQRRCVDDDGQRGRRG